VKLNTPPALGVVCLLVVMGLTNRARAQAGPPFLTNDPGTPGNANWEINIASAQSIRRGIATYQVPQIDLNFGVGDRIQLTYEVPYVVETEAGRPQRSGWSNAFPGIKWRFLDQGENGWQAAIFPQMETNGLASAKLKDIAVAGPRWLLPLEATKRLGPVDCDVEIGYYLPDHGMRERILGLVVGRSLFRSVDLALELYNDHVTGAPLDETTLDMGGRFKMSGGVVALFMAGRSIGGISHGPEYIGYFGVQILLNDYGRALERSETPVAFGATRQRALYSESSSAATSAASSVR